MHSSRRKRILGFVVPIAALIAACSHSVLAAEVDFVRDIRPILSENCFFCHGPDRNTREAGLRLDTRDDAHSVLEPGDSDASELIQRLISDDPDTLMPPADSNRSLSPQQIKLLRQWIDAGATWETHWSFSRIESPVVPKFDDQSSIRNPIDAFVLSKLSGTKLRPSPTADRRTLIRRLSLDLTGLPPTPAEVDTFLADTSADAYGQLVDRLLKSPEYGKRMAWDWLDAARYADTNGYQGDRERTMWPWRDWVVKAFNDNLPYDDFTVYQLAGDLLPDATADQRLATGFCRNHMINGEGGRIAEENRVEYGMDMSETMGTVWLGLTLNCCRCHDHKYDPLTNEDYYKFFAFFDQTPVTGAGGDPQTAPNMQAPSADQSRQLTDLEADHRVAETKLNGLRQSIDKTQGDWENEQRLQLGNQSVWRFATPTSATADGQTIEIVDAKLNSEPQTLLTSGANPANDNYSISLTSTLKTVSAIRLEALRHPSMTKGRLARSDSGNFVLTDVQIMRVNTDTGKKTALVIKSAEATFEQGPHKAANLIDDNSNSGWAVLNGKTIDRNHAVALRFATPVEIGQHDILEVTLRHQSPHKYHNLGHFRFSVTDQADAALEQSDEALLVALGTPARVRSDGQTALLAQRHRQSIPAYERAKSQLDSIIRKQTALQKSIPKVMVMQDISQPRQSFMLDRGLYNKPGDKVFAGFPESIVSKQSDEVNNRLSLARWLVSRDHPLTARVTVNRLWQQVFGIGLVKTTEDFGAQGEIPIQMDLLNWLAADFIDSDWNVKALMRKIVTSHTYRQTSDSPDPDAHQADPENRYLSRGARYRLPSWMIRDQALAASGLLSGVRGGPAVNTYQPTGVWEEASFGKKTYTRDVGEKLYRPSLYVFWRRIVAPTMFFDSASRQSCAVKSGRTNTPLHALLTLNDVTYVEAARALAELAMNSVNDNAKRLDVIFQRVLTRSPSSDEQAIMLAGLQASLDQYSGHPDAAAKLIAVGESKPDPALDTIQHASWTALCLAVLNLDETLTRE